MATVQHRDIPEVQLHEPKGASTALAGTTYVASGAGSGTWRKVGTDILQGMTGDLGVAGKRVVSNGSNGLALVADAAYGVATITTNTTNFTTVAAADATLKTAAQFQLFTGTGAPWVGDSLFNTTFTTDRLTAQVTGVYRIDLSMSIKAFPTNTAKVATKFAINSTVFAQRNQIAKSNAAGDEEQLSGFIITPMTAGDYVQVYLACSASGSLLVNDADFTINMLRAT